ncbi:MAG: hypothetical protein R2772_11725 [Chitinophagales bacterium]
MTSWTAAFKEKGFYSNRTQARYGFDARGFYLLPASVDLRPNYSEQIADAIKNLLFSMIGPRSKVAKASIYLPEC